MAIATTIIPGLNLASGPLNLPYLPDWAVWVFPLVVGALAIFVAQANLSLGRVLIAVVVAVPVAWVAYHARTLLWTTIGAVLDPTTPYFQALGLVAYLVFFAFTLWAVVRLRRSRVWPLALALGAVVLLLPLAAQYASGLWDMGWRLPTWVPIFQVFETVVDTWILVWTAALFGAVWIGVRASLLLLPPRVPAPALGS